MLHPDNPWRKIMQHTLIAVFDNRADANNAKDDLMAAGFSGEDVKLSLGGTTDSAGGSTSAGSMADTSEPEHEGIGASIKHFFADIFGTDNSEHVQRYSTAVSRGHHVLTITVDSEPEVERAADVVERHGPVDIDEKHAEWAGGAGIASRESMRMSGAGGMQQSSGLSQQSTDTFLQQSDGDRNLFAQQSLNDDVPMGTTYQEPMGSATSLQSSGGSGSLQGSSLEGSARSTDALAGQGLQRDTSLTGSQQRDTGAAATGSTREVQRGGVRIFSGVGDTAGQKSGATGSMSDDDYYRKHWSSNFGSDGGSYDEYAPAYSYGSQMAGSDKYRGRQWDDVQSDLRSDWDSRYPDTSGAGGSTWERFKAAVRHGWEKIT
jgi:hypothetical protein